MSSVRVKRGWEGLGSPDGKLQTPWVMLAAGKERCWSLEKGDVLCHFSHKRDVLKNMPWVFLRNEDK